MGFLPLKIIGFALQIFSKLSGTETGSPEPTMGDDTGPTKAECGKDEKLPPSKILDILLLESGPIMISSKKSYSTSSHTHDLVSVLNVFYGYITRFTSCY